MILSKCATAELHSYPHPHPLTLCLSSPCLEDDLCHWHFQPSHQTFCSALWVSHRRCLVFEAQQKGYLPPVRILQVPQHTSLLFGAFYSPCRCLWHGFTIGCLHCPRDSCWLMCVFGTKYIGLTQRYWWMNMSSIHIWNNTFSRAIIYFLLNHHMLNIHKCFRIMKSHVFNDTYNES